MSSKSKHLLLKLLTFVLVLASSILIMIICVQAVTENQGTPSEKTVILVKPVNTVIKISALGDVALGQDSRFLYQDSFDYAVNKLNKDYGFFFSNVIGILSKDDITIANLETSLTGETQKAVKYDYGNNYWFKGSTIYTEILKAGSIEAVSLSNNHTYDYMQKGFDDTRNSLKAAGIDYFGYSDVSYRNVKGITVGMLGFNQLGNYEQGTKLPELEKQVTDMIKIVKAKSNLVIVTFHWGKEYTYTINSVQKELGHLAVDSGADVVIGTHPHVLQPIEKYKNKYIAYSLGNFCFGGAKTERDYDTCIYQQSFSFTDKKLQQVDSPSIIPCSISSVQGKNDYKPSLAVGDKINNVKKKLGEKVPEKTDMIRVDSLIKDIAVDLKYASTDNITGTKVYKSDVAYLRRGTAEKLNNANALLLKKGYRIKIWDAYRPPADQYILWNKATDKTYFADPKKGSNHSRGAAVDITLIKLDGSYVDMPSGFDEQSLKASRKYSLATSTQKANALLLENTMKSCGFIPLQTEWWHFDDTQYKNYSIIDFNTETN